MMAIFVDRGQGFAEQEVAPIRVLGRFTLKPGICADENGIECRRSRWCRVIRNRLVGTGNATVARIATEMRACADALREVRSQALSCRL